MQTSHRWLYARALTCLDAYLRLCLYVCAYRGIQTQMYAEKCACTPRACTNAVCTHAAHTHKSPTDTPAEPKCPSISQCTFVHMHVQMCTCAMHVHSLTHIPGNRVLTSALWRLIECRSLPKQSNQRGTHAHTSACICSHTFKQSRICELL